MTDCCSNCVNTDEQPLEKDTCHFPPSLSWKDSLVQTKTNHLKYFECMFCKGTAEVAVFPSRRRECSLWRCRASSKHSYKGQLIWVGFIGGRDVKVSQASPEPINLCLNEVAHRSAPTLPASHHSPPSLPHAHSQMCKQTRILSDQHCRFEIYVPFLCVCAYWIIFL